MGILFAPRKSNFGDPQIVNQPFASGGWGRLGAVKTFSLVLRCVALVVDGYLKVPVSPRGGQSPDP